MSKQPPPKNTLQQRRQTYTQRSKPPQGFDLIQNRLNEFKAKMREAEGESNEYMRKNQILWQILRLTHQKSRYVYQMFLKKKISQDVLHYCQELQLVDGNLINYWKKPGYEYLCCLQCAQHTSKFGSGCICRVPANQLAQMEPFECKSCGCRGCSGIKTVEKSTAVERGNENNGGGGHSHASEKSDGEEEKLNPNGTGDGNKE